MNQRNERNDASIRLGYHFVPIPYRVQTSRQGGRLSPQGQDLIRVLFAGASWRPLVRGEECTRLTLAQIRERMPYTESDESLARLVRRLRDQRWFTFRLERRSRAETYIFRLLVDEEDRVTSRSPRGESFLWSSEEDGHPPNASAENSGDEQGNPVNLTRTGQALERTAVSRSRSDNEGSNPHGKAKSRATLVRTGSRTDKPPNADGRKLTKDPGPEAKLERTGTPATPETPNSEEEALLDQFWSETNLDVEAEFARLYPGEHATTPSYEQKRKLVLDCLVQERKRS
jgi:hypothetical protein